jgi:hypothetical protein
MQDYDTTIYQAICNLNLENLQTDHLVLENIRYKSDTRPYFCINLKTMLN